MKHLFSILLVSLSFSFVFAQNPGWHELGSGANALNANDSILCVSSDYSGNVYCAGAFTNPSGRHYVAKWDGTSWTELGGLNALNANGNINCIKAMSANSIYAAGSFSNSGGKFYLAHWNGSVWSEVGAGSGALNANGPIRCMSIANGIYVGGDFKNTNGSCYIAKFDYATNIWSEVGGGNSLNANGSILSIVTGWPAYGGKIHCAGNFRNSFGNLRVAQFNGTVWNDVANFPGYCIYDLNDGYDGSGGAIFAGITRNFPNLSQTYGGYNNSWASILNQVCTSNINNGSIRVLKRNDKDYLPQQIAAGNFKNANGFRYVAIYSTWYWDNSGFWSEIGGSSVQPLNANGEILSVDVDTMFNIVGQCNFVKIVAAGKFTNSAGKYYVSEYLEPVISGTPGTPQSNVVATADTICHGTQVAFNCTTTNAGNAPLYDWYKNSTSLGLNTSNISLNNLNNKDSIWCVVNPNTVCVAASSVQSNKIHITDFQTPFITLHPQSVTVNVGSTTYFKTVATNTTQYQWQVNNGTGYQNLSNAGNYIGVTTDSLSVINVHLGLANNYYRCIATNGICTDTSNYAVLNVTQGNGTNNLSITLFDVYPNPANSHLIISNVPYNSSISITNLMGQSMLKSTLNSGSNQLNISSLNDGVYLLHCGNIVRRIVIAR